MEKIQITIGGTPESLVINYPITVMIDGKEIDFSLNAEFDAQGDGVFIRNDIWANAGEAPPEGYDQEAIQKMVEDRAKELIPEAVNLDYDEPNREIEPLREFIAPKEEAFVSEQFKKDLDYNEGLHKYNSDQYGYTLLRSPYRSPELWYLRTYSTSISEGVEPERVGELEEYMYNTEAEALNDIELAHSKFNTLFEAL